MKKKLTNCIHDFGCRKLMRVMKLTVFFVLTGLLAISAESYSQVQRLNLNMRDAQIVDVFNAIEQQSGFYFFYKNDELNVSEKVDAQFQDATIDHILSRLLQGKRLSYKIVDRYIVISPDAEVGFTKQQGTKKVQGKITDPAGLPLPGVTVVVKGTTQGTITDANGDYSLLNVPDNAVLVFSFVGMKTQEIPVVGKMTIHVIMEEETIGIEEVVAVGYGTMRKSDLTGSVASVNSEEISAYPAIGMVQSLQGRAAGVMVQSNNGEPGSSYKVRIRGASSINSSSDPLFVVDGFPGGTMPPSEDIESVEVLKDASATAIYGSRGANGVILVTTKHGKAGKTMIELKSSYSLQGVINRLDLLETPDYINYVNEVTPGLLNPDSSYPNTDWQDNVFRNGGIQNYQLSLSGGNENIRYYVSGIVYDQKGVVIDSKYERYSITSNLNIQAGKNLEVGVNLFASRYLSDGIVSQEWSAGGGQAGVMSATVLMEPIVPVYNEDGTYATSSLTGQEHDNPVAIAKELSIDEVGDNIQANVYGEYQLTKDLKFRTTFGARAGSGRNGRYLPSTMYGGRELGGQAYIDGSRSTDIVNENYFTFNKNFNDIHDITLMAGYSYQSSRYEYWRAISENFITDAFSFWNLGGGSVAKNPTSSLTESELASFYGRLNYKLFNRYLFTFNARYDGSSRFAKNNKWAFFPSGALAWNVSEENFMKNMHKISLFKLRASYGITGNQAISPYESLARLASIPSTIINNELVNAVAPSTVANENLTWESTAQTDIGFDLGLFSQRIYLVGDYYYKKTTDLLFSLPLPEYSGYTSLLKNIGSIENKGVEFTLSTVNFDGDFKWTTDFNLSRHRNKILELPDGNDIFVDTSPGHMVGITNSTILREGEPMGQFFGYVYDGVYQEGDTFLPGGGFEQGAGGEKFRNISGDDELNSDDRTIIGDPNPDFIWGLNNTLEYKGFDMNVFIQASQGNDIYSFTLFELELMSGYNNSTTRALKRWTPINTNTDVPKASDSRPRKSSSRFVYDGSFIRLRNLSLGYKLPASIIKPAGISFARIYISAQNLFTITDYPGYDPEVNWMGGGSYGGNVNLGLDYGSYPNAKSYTIGIQVKF